MANGHGGARKGAGRKTLRFGFRSWCREIVSSPEVQETIKQAAIADPMIALRLAEHGWGRAPQGLEITHRGDDDSPLTFRVFLADGRSLPAGSTNLSGAGTTESGEG